MAGAARLWWLNPSPDLAALRAEAGSDNPSGAGLALNLLPGSVNADGVLCIIIPGNPGQSGGPLYSGPARRFGPFGLQVKRM